MAELRAAAEADLGAIRALLESAGLPTTDLQAAKPSFTLLREHGAIVAAGALQRFGSAALLRSLVVATDRRGTGLGSIIVHELEKVAAAVRIRRLFLLTPTAREFFTHQGYRVVERSEAPQDIQGSEEFRSLCPASAICMMKVLADSP